MSNINILNNNIAHNFRLDTASQTLSDNNVEIINSITHSLLGDKSQADPIVNYLPPPSIDIGLPKLHQRELSEKKEVNKLVIPTAIGAKTLPLSKEYTRLCTEPYKLLAEIKERKSKKDYTLFDPSFAFLNVCPCHKMNDSLREQIETYSIDLLKESSPLNQPLTILSVGPGGCYEELVFLAKLRENGYCKLKLVLVDPAQLNCGIISMLCENHFPESFIEIIKYDDLQSYICDAAGSLNPDLLLLIDLSDEKYKIDGQKLTDYSFTLLKREKILAQDTVLVYSDLELIVDENSLIATPKATCSRVGTAESLNELTLDRKAFYGSSIAETV